MSELTDAVETLMMALGDAMQVWGRVGEQVRRLEDRTAALALKVDMLVQTEKSRAVPAGLGPMFKGVAKRLAAVEGAQEALAAEVKTLAVVVDSER